MTISKLILLLTGLIIIYTVNAVLLYGDYITKRREVMKR